VSTAGFTPPAFRADIHTVRFAFYPWTMVVDGWRQHAHRNEAAA
jgi:hypothetical protein